MKPIFIKTQCTMTPVKPKISSTYRTTSKLQSNIDEIRSIFSELLEQQTSPLLFDQSNIEKFVEQILKNIQEIRNEFIKLKTRLNSIPMVGFEDDLQCDRKSQSESSMILLNKKGGMGREEKLQAQKNNLIRQNTIISTKLDSANDKLKQKQQQIDELKERIFSRMQEYDNRFKTFEGQKQKSKSLSTSPQQTPKSQKNIDLESPSKQTDYEKIEVKIIVDEMHAMVVSGKNMQQQQMRCRIMKLQDKLDFLREKNQQYLVKNRELQKQLKTVKDEVNQLNRQLKLLGQSKENIITTIILLLFPEDDVKTYIFPMPFHSSQTYEYNIGLLNVLAPLETSYDQSDTI